MAAVQSGGRWRQAVELQMPADAAANPNAFVDSLACVGAGSCAAVGSYLPSIGGLRAFVAAERSGTWTRAVTLRLPANAAAPTGSGR